MSTERVGLLDTNVVVHSLLNDAHSAECRQFLSLVQEGSVRVRIEPMVIHELAYVLTTRGRRMSVEDAADLLDSLLRADGVAGEVDLLIKAVSLWKQHAGIDFVDCYLAAKAISTDAPVYSKNIRHFRRLGVESPDPMLADYRSLN
ncbi:MAG: PIN domain-containing protein [Thermomicrobiales bacterium]|nr:PIN domain-containing protein [Thermomicrobiales bacterium]